MITSMRYKVIANTFGLHDTVYHSIPLGAVVKLHTVLPENQGCVYEDVATGAKQIIYDDHVEPVELSKQEAQTRIKEAMADIRNSIKEVADIAIKHDLILDLKLDPVELTCYRGEWSTL